MPTNENETLEQQTEPKPVDNKPDIVKSEEKEPVVTSSDVPEIKAEAEAKAERPEIVGSDLDEARAALEAEPKIEPDKEPTKDEKEKAEFDALPEGFRKRLARSTRQRDEANAAIAGKDAEIERLKAEKTVSDNDGEPEKKPSELLNADDFDSFDDMITERERLETVERKEAKGEGKPKDKASSVDFVDGVPMADFGAARDDLMDTVNAADPDLWAKAGGKTDDGKTRGMSGSMVVALSELDAPAPMLQHLVDNPDQAVKMSVMTPYKLAKEIIKLEGELNAKPTPKVTSAPEPIEIGGSRGHTQEKTREEMTQREFDASREAEEKSAVAYWL